MTTKKICDKCKAPAVDSYALECEYCGGSTFSHIQDEASKESPSFQRAPSVNVKVTSGKSQANSYDYNPSIVEGLLDTTFQKYVTRKLASFTYQVALFVMVLIVILCGGLLIFAAISEQITATVWILVFLVIVIVLLFALIWLASLRLRLESFTSLVQISKNTQDSKN
jgi:hypothetical protein